MKTTMQEKLTISTLIDMREEAEKMEKDLEIICTRKQLGDLLSDTEVTSADYNVVRALVRGDISTFMGVTFHIKTPPPLERGKITVDIAEDSD